ncbi:MAG: acyltransferase [Clostridia bacterium]|nr:acyltransferase [Clostridia bacterium]
MSGISNIRKRNHTLDIFKAFAAFFIVFIHSKFPGTFGEVIASVAQSGVLLFFMISGYYIYNAESKKIVKSIKHIVHLIVIAYVLNIIRMFIQAGFTFPVDTFKSILSVKHILQFLVLNISSISGVLWFMLALLYCYVIYYILNKLKLTKLLYIVMPILLIVNLVIGDLLVHIGVSGFAGFVRNFFVTGIPFFALGNFIHHKYDKISASSLFKRNILLIIVFGGLTFSVLEALLTQGCQYTVGNVVFAIGLFMISLYSPSVNNNALEFIGGKCCFWIYILHPIMIHIWNYILCCIPDSTFVNWISPLCVLAMTVAVSVSIELIKNKLVKKTK